MLTTFLALASSLTDQFNASISKEAVTNKNHSISIWNIALISLLSGSLFIFIAGFQFITIFPTFILSGLFITRIILEIFQIFVTYNALRYSQLSTFNFIRGFSVVSTIILEIILLGTVLSTFNYLGIALIVTSISIIFIHGLKELNGWSYLIMSTVNGGILNAIAKLQYQGESVYFVESWVRIILIIILIIISLINFSRTSENLIGDFKIDSKLFLSVPLIAITRILGVTALSLGSASTFVALERGGSAFFGVILGHKIFKEKSLGEKLLISAGIFSGVLFIAFG